MPGLLHQRCFNHADREAAARCPECSHFFCRECVTEHDDRVLCSACLKKLVRLPPPRTVGLARLKRLGQFAAGLIVAWFFFFLVGEGLLRIPVAVHEGALWHISWLDKK